MSWVVILDRLAEADWDEYFWGVDRRPTVAAYWRRLQARPSYKEALYMRKLGHESHGTYVSYATYEKKGR